MVALVLVLLILPTMGYTVQRFPPPDFDSGHTLPRTVIPEPRALIYEYLDVMVLLIALSLASYLALKSRSRRGIFLLGIFSLAYFGFWRKGCVCYIGSLQNITLALFDHSYTVPLVIIAFFSLPLIFTLFFGRTFCAAVCPLGAIQDVVVLRPIRVPSWLEHALGLFAYIYLGLAVLFAATGSAFIICQYDPFVSFFRRSGSLDMLILGGGFLLVGLFVGRPYCRYLCPYGALLNLVSRASKWHVTITPKECIQCRLCEESCAFGAIQEPTPEAKTTEQDENKRRFTYLLLLLPVFMLFGGWLGTRVSDPLSRMHPTVRLAEQIWSEDTGDTQDSTDASDAFRSTGRSKYELYDEALQIKNQFAWGSGLLGAFVGLVICLKLIFLAISRRRSDYEVNRGTCISCARCFAYCPVEHERLKERGKDTIPVPGRI